MAYNTENYKEQGGKKWVVEGTLDLTNATVEGVVTAPVIDTLVSTSATSALSAKQGKALKGLIDGQAPVDSLASDSATTPLSANQGKVLKDAADLKVAANQADSVEADSPTTAEFNGLLAKLKAAGLMVDDA